MYPGQLVSLGGAQRAPNGWIARFPNLSSLLRCLLSCIKAAASGRSAERDGYFQLWAIALYRLEEKLWLCSVSLELWQWILHSMNCATFKPGNC